MSQMAARLSGSTLEPAAPAERAAGLSFFWPLAVAAAILYGSLIPFEFDITALAGIEASTFFGLRFRGTTPEDLFTNVLVYMPLGLAIVLCGDRRRVFRLVRVPVAVLVGIAVSLLAEGLQTAIAIRVASLTDVALNTVGTFLGAMLAAALYESGSRALNRCRQGLIERPAATQTQWLTVGLLLFCLAPFDFVLDSAALHDSFRAARWDLTGIRSAGIGEPAFELFVSQLSTAAWFGLLGYLFVMARETAGRHPVLAWASAVRHGVIVAGLIELLQLFTVSHRFDLASAVLRVMAMGLGAWLAAFLLFGRSGQQRKPRSTLPIRTAFLIALALGQILAVFLASLDSQQLSLSGFDPASVGWIPFEALWRRPMVSAASDVLATVAVFSTLGLTIAIILRRRGFRFAWPLSALVVTLVALGAQVFELCSPSRTADSTGPALALAAVLLAFQVEAAFRSRWTEPDAGSAPVPAVSAEPFSPTPSTRPSEPLPTS